MTNDWVKGGRGEGLFSAPHNEAPKVEKNRKKRVPLYSQGREEQRTESVEREQEKQEYMVFQWDDYCLE